MRKVRYMADIKAETLVAELQKHLGKELSNVEKDVRDIAITDALYPIQRIADFRDQEDDVSEDLRFFIENYRFNKFEFNYGDEDNYEGYDEEVLYETCAIAQELAGRYLDDKYNRHDYIVV